MPRSNARRDPVQPRLSIEAPSGAPFIERVDLLVKLVSDQLGASSAEIDRTVQTDDQKLNEKIVAGGSGSE